MNIKRHIIRRHLLRSLFEAMSPSDVAALPDPAHLREYSLYS